MRAFVAVVPPPGVMSKASGNGAGGETIIYPDKGSTRATAPTLPATLRLGAVHLTVSDLDRSVAFYESALGLGLHRREDGTAAMGVGGARISSFCTRSRG